MTPYAIVWLCIILPVSGALVGLGDGAMTALIALGGSLSLVLMGAELLYMRAHPHDDFAGVALRWLERLRDRRAS